jgi:hypothetical protein
MHGNAGTAGSATVEGWRRGCVLLVVQSHDPPLSFTTFAGPKYRKPKMASHDLRARSFEDSRLYNISHGPLQLQMWTAFLLPARLLPTAVCQSATQLSHTTFSQLSEPTQGSSTTCRLLFPSPARFSALHCSPHLHKRAVVALTP